MCIRDSEDPQNLTAVTANRYGYGLMSEEDKAALKEAVSYTHLDVYKRQE